MRVSPDLLAKCLELAGLADPPAPAPPPEVSEKDFQADVIREAKRLGWKAYHTYRSTKSESGFPDLVLVRGKRLIFAELKRAGERPTAAQEAWGELLSGIGPPVEYYVWKPADWREILTTLE